MPYFGPAHFQLALLRRMADHHPDLVDGALRSLNASHADLREAHRAWQARLHSRTFPRGERGYRLLLGPPEQEVERRVGDLTCRALLWPLPLWPDLRWEVLCAPGGTAVWNEWLVRAPGTEPPRLSRVEDLTPWSCVVDDVARAFPPATPLPADAPSRARLAVTAPATGERIVAHFTWGLLQFTDPP
ncbi:hypothetical protein [Actinacidiphila cocklensis]|uniref:Uncharacterized protein n=1 Tax=Actinacidiphila cocklensis TaxID=887465 RepID=A0A9W4DN85_9ACTN|nr:conserved hypothetical protein [Actinacidiphila cocklensis]